MTSEETGSNLPLWAVSELSAAIRGELEGRFGRVRVRGEIGRVSRPASGHVYFDLREHDAILAAVAWRSQAARLDSSPEEGMEVIATGRVSAYQGQSKYQLIVEELEHAGVGALLKAIEDLRRRLAEEGLFDEERKQPIPRMPEVIGVVTSPSGAVLQDILHRLRDRFPSRVIVWPASVQGRNCPDEVREAIEGFNALSEGGPIPRPDLLIVARGGGSVEDLAGFSDESVVRAVAASRIPVISAVGHETDTTLIDHAADLRAPTPTAAAEHAVPVREELRASLATLGGRTETGWGRIYETRRLELESRRATLRSAEELLSDRIQRLDAASERLPGSLIRRAEGAGYRFKAVWGRLDRGWQLTHQSHLHRLALPRATLPSGDAYLRRLDQRLSHAAKPLRPALERHLDSLNSRMKVARRMLETVSHKSTLGRGFALVRRADGGVMASADALRPNDALELEFQDGRVAATAGERIKRS